MHNELSRKQFFVTPAHSCSYLPDREARTLFLDPRETVDEAVYSLLTRAGFRRSGAHLYRPHCEGCEACVPLRIPVADFKLTRRFKRTLKRNEDLTTDWLPARFDDEHYALYERYIEGRHHDGDMYPPSPDQFRSFLLSAWSETWFLTARSGRRLASVAVTDQLNDGLSAIYTYFEPGDRDRSLGVYSVLRQIEKVQELGLDFLYLGYWVRDCFKMSYKTDYRPYETYTEGHWQRIPTTSL